MKLYREELIFYLFVPVSFIFAVLFGLLTYRTPDLQPPSRATEREGWEIDIPQLPPINEPSSSPVGDTFAIFRIIFLILLVLLIGIIIYRISTISGGWFSTKSGMKELSEKIQRVKDARSEAYKIIEQGLENETYTVSYISAYLALDSALDFFREIRRPQHWTPKEYAYSVSEPVFRPAVYKFVQTFYDLRYGSEQAVRQDLINFKLELDYLFIDDVPSDIIASWEHEYLAMTGNSSVYQIPRWGNLTQPGGNK